MFSPRFIFVDRAGIGNDNCDTLPTELALSSKKNRSKEPCCRCGAVVSVPASQQSKVYCVDCRPKSKANNPASEAAPADNSVELTVDDILTITCQLCRSSLLVDQSKLGTQVVCPDCHSSIVVTRPTRRTKRKTGRPQPKKNKRVFDPNAELTLEEPVDRPTLDRSADLDDATEDLLSAPLPQVEPLPESLEDGDELFDEDLDNGSIAGEPSLTRRQRYERMQQRMISEGRQQMRKEAREKLAARKSGRRSLAADAEDSNPHRRKRRRRRKGKRGREFRSPGWAGPAFGWLRQRSMVVGWLLAIGCLSVPYFSGADWNPLALLDQGFKMATQTPMVLDVLLIVNTVLLMAGSLVVYFLCGRSFAINAERAVGPDSGSERDAEADSDESLDVSSVFTTLHFGFAWLFAGLPFLFASIVLLPAQFLIVPPLLIGSWLNGSVWKFVFADGLIHPERQQSSRRLWRKFYSLLFVAAAISIPPVLAIQSGGVLTVIGWILVSGIMIGVAGICGHHCRELSKWLEPSV